VIEFAFRPKHSAGYRGMNVKGKLLAGNNEGQQKILRPVVFRPILTDGLALSIEPILPGKKDMSIKAGNAMFLTELYSLSPCQELTNCGRINHLSIGDEKPQFR